MAKILVADDDANLCHLVQDLLERRRHSVSVVGSGKEAYTLLTSCRDLYKLAIIDVMMQDWSGLEAIELSRGLGVTLPIILMSGLPVDNLPSGVPFLPKPFEFTEFYALVDVLLQLHTGVRATGDTHDTERPV